MPLYTFACPQGHVADKIVPYNTQRTECPICGKKAKRKGIEVPARRNPAHGLQS